MPPRFRVSPSVLARTFFHDCDRFLHYSAATKETRAAEGLPSKEWDRSPLMDAILEGGYEWEEAVLARYLKGKVAIALGDGKVRDRRFGIEETVERLESEPAGRWIYQTTLEVPPAFYERHGIDPELVDFAPSHPDLLEVRTGPTGRRRFRVVDLKRGSSLRPAHAIHVGLYALILETLLESRKIDADVDLGEGAVWLGEHPAATPFDLAGALPHVRRFLREDLARVLGTPTADVAWHLHFRCEWCEYFDHCRGEMRSRDDVSRIPNLTPFGKRHLAREAKVTTLPELDGFLERPDADAVLGRCASLAGQRHHLKIQADALRSGAVRLHGGSSAALPRYEDLAVFVTVQSEPLGQSSYAAGILVSPFPEKPATKEALGDFPWAAPEVRVAGTPGEVGSVRTWLVEKLHDLLSRVHEFNAKRDWTNKVSLQFYVHAERERALLVKTLLEALEDKALAERAMTLLFHFQGPDLVHANEHPRGTVSHPVVVLLSSIGQLAALPVEVSATLPESLAALGTGFTYERNDRWHFPLGHGIKADTIHQAWYGGEAERADWVRGHLSTYLYAVRTLLFALRKQAKEQLFAYPPKFAFPDSSGIRDRVLSRLAFFVRYESLLGCLRLRDSRTEARPVQLLLGTAVELVAESAKSFAVAGEPSVELGTDGFANWLLVRDTPEGRRAQLEFSDYALRAAKWNGAREHDHRAIVAIDGVEPDALGFPRRIELDLRKPFAGSQPSPGERFLLYPRFTDWTTDRIVRYLEQLDREGLSGPFLQLLAAPEEAAVQALFPGSIEGVLRAEESALALTPSQIDAYRRIRLRKITAVWGPPGTGKTHFLAAAIAGIASAHAATNRPFRVLVTAFTHAAIENVLRKLRERLDGNTGPRPALALGKAGGWRESGVAAAEDVDPGSIGMWLALHPLAVVGATVFACVKTLERERERPLCGIL